MSMNFLYYIIDFPKNLFIPKKMWYNMTKEFDETIVG